MKEVTKTVTAYVAEDGTEWETKALALEQDRKLAAMQKEDEVDKLIIDELYGVVPPYPYADVSSNTEIIWYLLKDEKDHRLLEDYLNDYDDNRGFDVAKYPAVICVGKLGGSCLVHDFNDICNGIKEFVKDVQNAVKNRLVDALDDIEILDSEDKADDETTLDYEQLAITIIEEYDSDREETGRKEIEEGMEYVLDKYQTAHDRKIIDDMLMTFTGYSLESLKKKYENQ